MASLLLATTVGGYGVIHSNNIGSQSVSYATSAGSSDTATNSSQLNGLSKAQLWNNSGQAHVAYQSFDAIPDFGVWFMQNSSAGDTPQTGSQFYVQTQGLGDDYGYGATTGNYALMTAVARDHAVKYTYYRTLENGTWGSWKKSAAGYSDSAGSLTSMNISQFTNNSGYITSVGNITRLWAESHPDDYYVRANWTGSYWQLTSNHPSPVQVGYADNAGAVAWGNVSSKPSYIMYYQGFTLDANTMDTNSTGFTYSVNAPFTGPIARFSTGGQYDLWLGGSYSGGGNSFFLRTRNGDNNTLNAWREIITSGNIGSQSVSYATSAGSAPNGSNANSFYDVTPGDGNGLRFWSSDQYKISMGVGSLYQYGTVYDYSIKTQMDAGSPGRGFTWGRINIAPIASLNATSGNFQVAGTIANGSIWINNGANYNDYNENIRLFDAPNGVSVIAFSASGTGGSPRTSLLGFSDRLETRVSDTWEQRIYGGYVEARGSFRAPIFYDSNDTTYYGDFASTSFLRHLSVGDVNASNDGGWNARLNLTGSSHARLDVKSNSDGIITTMYSHAGQGVGRVGTMSNHPLAFMVNGNVAGYAYANYLQGVDSVRAPIFYDSEDTNYYINPNGYSQTSSIYANNWFRAQSNTGLYFSTYGRGIWAADSAGASYGNVSIYGDGLNDWPGYAINNLAIFMARDIRSGIFIPSADSWLIRYEQSGNQAIVDFELSWGSDIRYKSNIKTIENSLNKVKALRGVTYSYKGAEKTSIGFIAQEVEPILPEVVSTDADGFKGVGYANIVALLVEAIKEQQTIIDDLKTRINNLESK